MLINKTYATVCMEKATIASTRYIKYEKIHLTSPHLKFYSQGTPWQSLSVHLTAVVGSIL